ncbi:MAG TPA: ribonuclease H-like domain-containing protein [Candidatus Hydrogenedentes bacterium]|nr:ribonuclease H-like domain-containing protein [Candidatus Hydrogenedentota bacterium]
MPDTKDKLKELLARHDLMTGAEWGRKRAELEERRVRGDFEIDRIVPGEVVGDGEDRFYRVVTEFPPETQQGGLALGDVLEAIPEHVALCACDPDLDDFDPATALFLDVETTGLAGGTGTVPFLVGAGFFDNGVFRLEQTFMRDFDEEEPMLRYLGALFARGTSIVTFNGKSFDVPLLRTRFIAHRLPFRLDGIPHFDLLHAVRRIWKLRVKDCSLGNIERAVLGLERRGDVPGADIPLIWFDYLRTRDARELKRVFYHHRMDILSLAALTARLSRGLAAPGREGFDHDEDRLSVVRLHFRQRRYDDVISRAEQLLCGEPDPVLRRECLAMLAFACKRRQDWEGMESAWDRMAREFPFDPLPRLELAKHYEHRARNLPEARRVCEEAIALLGADEDDPATHAIRQRLERIRRKLAKGGEFDL